MDVYTSKLPCFRTKNCPKIADKTRQDSAPPKKSNNLISLLLQWDGKGWLKGLDGEIYDSKLRCVSKLLIHAPVSS